MKNKPLVERVRDLEEIANAILEHFDEEVDENGCIKIPVSILADINIYFGND